MKMKWFCVSLSFLIVWIIFYYYLSRHLELEFYIYECLVKKRNGFNYGLYTPPHQLDAQFEGFLDRGIIPRKELPPLPEDVIIIKEDLKGDGEYYPEWFAGIIGFPYGEMSLWKETKRTKNWLIKDGNKPLYLIRKYEGKSPITRSKCEKLFVLKVYKFSKLGTDKS